MIVFSIVISIFCVIKMILWILNLVKNLKKMKNLKNFQKTKIKNLEKKIEIFENKIENKMQMKFSLLNIHPNFAVSLIDYAIVPLLIDKFMRRRDLILIE